MRAPKPTSRGRPCGACGVGFLIPTNLRGQALDDRDALGLVVDRDLVVPRCDACGDLVLDASDTARLNAALEELRRAR